MTTYDELVLEDIEPLESELVFIEQHPVKPWGVEDEK